VANPARPEGPGYRRGEGQTSHPQQQSQSCAKAQQDGCQRQWELFSKNRLNSASANIGWGCFSRLKTAFFT
jgi:hypothetical protein